MTRIFLASFVAIGIAASTIFAFQKQDQDKKKPKPDDKIEIPQDDENSMARRDFMRTKLLFSQNIFEGLTRGNFVEIESAIEELRGITEGGAWVAIDNDQYRKLTQDFETSVQRLGKAAESGNIEAVALRYYQMSTSCIDCHQHIRKAKYQF